MARLERPWYERARLQLWYWAVADLKGGNPDYGLDVQFAYRRKLAPIERKGRRRVFEWLRKAGREPRGGHSDLRSMEEIINAVDADPGFRGTAAIFNSKIWELFALSSISDAEILKRIDDVFVENGVERFPFPALESYRYGRNPDLDVQNPVNPIEHMRLKNAKVSKITFEYLSLLIFLFYRTTVIGRDEGFWDFGMKSLAASFETRLKQSDLPKKYTSELLKWIQDIEVVRVF